MASHARSSSPQEQDETAVPPQHQKTANRTHTKDVSMDSGHDEEAENDAEIANHRSHRPEASASSTSSSDGDAFDGVQHSGREASTGDCSRPATTVLD